MNTIINKLTSIAKISIGFTALLTFSVTAHAEYYVATSGCNVCPPVVKKCCRKPCKKRVHRKRCHRRIPRCGCRSVAFYYMAPVAPPCWGGERWIPGGCGPCGSVMVPSHWRPVDRGNYQEVPIRYINDIIYDPDLATADDNAFFYPDMQINW